MTGGARHPGSRSARLRPTRVAVAVAIAVVIAVFAVAVVMALGANGRGAGVARGVVTAPDHRGDPNNAIIAVRGAGPRVALSFDDGPWPASTRKVLAFLARERARATFFSIGRRAVRHPEVVREQLAAGHEVGSHTWSHPLLPPLSDTRLRAEIADGERALRRIAEGRVALFRPPHGYFDRRVSAAVAAAGLRMVGWDVPLDRLAHGRDARAAARAVLARIRPGSIVLAHDTPRGAARAIAILSIVLPELRRRGLRVVTVSELLRAASVAQPRRRPAAAGHPEGVADTRPRAAASRLQAPTAASRTAYVSARPRTDTQ